MSTDTDTRMAELAKAVAADLQAENDFDPEDWELGDTIPSDIAAHLAAEFGFDRSHVWQRGHLTGVVTCGNCGLLPLDDTDREAPCMGEEEQRDLIREAFEAWQDDVTDGVLDISADVSISGAELIPRHVTLVLGTGGPHVEVTLDEDGDGFVTAYDWFGAGRTQERVSLGNHPLMRVVEYAHTIFEEASR